MNPIVKSLINNRNFLLLWCAYGISAVGDHLSEMAILATQNALDPGVDITPLQARMTFLFMLPFFLLGPITGAIADRVPRRAVMIFADLARAAIMFGFFYLIRQFSGGLGGWGPFLPLMFLGIFAALFSPARAAMVPTLVRNDELVSANAMIGGLGMIGTMCAAVVSGELADRGLIREAFNLDGATFLLSAICVYLISPRRGHIDEHRFRPHGSLLTRLTLGFRFIATHRRVAELFAIAMVFWFAGAMVRSVIPAIVKNVYQGSFAEMARFPAWIALGLASGALVVAFVGPALRTSIVITFALWGTGFGLIGLAATTFLGSSPRAAHVLGVIAVFACGFFGAGISSGYNALLQRFVPNHCLGRVYGALNVATVGALLTATGLLAIPQWAHLDRWAGFLLLAVAALLFVVGGLTYLHRQRRTSMGLLYAFYREITDLATKYWYRLRVTGRCTIPRTGPVIVTANHECHIDPLLICASCNYRLPSFMIAAEYYNAPLAGHFIKTAKSIPVRRGENDISATKTVIRRLRAGDAIGIFIQGGIRNDEDDDRLKNGVAMFALRTGAVVIPAHISGTRYHRSMFKSCLSRHRARIRYGPPVDLSEFADRSRGDSLDAATEKIFSAIMQLKP